MLARLRSGARGALTEWLVRQGQPERVARAVEVVQSTRARIEEVEGAVLHFWLLPGRDDVRSLRRRVLRLRKAVRAIGVELAQIEASVAGERGEQRGHAERPWDDRASPGRGSAGEGAP